MTMHIRAIHVVYAIRILISLIVITMLSAIAILLSGCRSNEIGTIRLTIPERAAEAMASGRLAAITITQNLYAGDLDIGQGKSIPVKALSDLAAAASQSGDASAALDDDSDTKAPVGTGNPPVVAPPPTAPQKPATTTPAAGETEAPPANTGGESTTATDPPAADDAATDTGQ